MCTKQEEREMVSFLAERTNLPEDKIIQAIVLAKERIRADGNYPDPSRLNQILVEEICANAALYGISEEGQRLAIITEASLNIVGAFIPTLDTSA